jgi:hypothetical protein
MSKVLNKSWMPEKKILMPEWTRFSDLFTGARPWSQGQKPALATLRSDQYTKPYRCGHGARPAYDHMRIGRYCPVIGPPKYRSLEITGITPALLALIERTMVIVDNDETNFEIIWRSNNKKALVTINHGQIIGNHWLAEIDTSTIP